jgi:S-DNA-T family DNA segregation ATPase FtsK/SpoIIIE
VVTDSTGPGRRLLDTAVGHIRSAATTMGVRAPVLLAPPLRSDLSRRDLGQAQRPWPAAGLVLGARDRPGIAEPSPFCFDLARDVTLSIVGGPRSGRTTALLALAEAARDQYDPSHPLVVHSIAWAPGLEAIEGASADGGVVRRGDFDHLRRLLTWLARDPGDAATRLVLIDRLDLLLRDVRELDGGALATQLVEILNDGPRRRLAAAVTIEPTALVPATGLLAGPRLVLPVDDATLAVAAGVPCRPDAPPGRGRLANGDEVQVGLPAEAAPASQPVAGRVERMPTTVALSAVAACEGERVAIGLGGADRLEPLVVDFDLAGPVIVVVGRAGSGRSTALDAFAAAYRGARRVLRQPEALPDEPSLLLVDDAARAATTRPWLDADDFPDTLRHGGHVAVVAYEQGDLTGLGYRHWLAKRTYPGLLLSLDATPDRIVAGERLGFLPPAELRAGPPGRGWWCGRGTGVPVQVAAISPEGPSRSPGAAVRSPSCDGDRSQPPPPES